MTQQHWLRGVLVAALAIVIPLQASVGAETATSLPAATSQPEAALQPSAADEQAIRATAEEFTRAFNAGDAKAVAALWAVDSVYTDESGQSYRGRDAIEQMYTSLFQQQHGDTMTIEIASIRFLGPDIAVEKGITTVKSPEEAQPTGARYTAVHARRDGKWSLAVVRDSSYTPGQREASLNDLAWLIGEWKAERPDAKVRLKFEWVEQKNFIKNTYLAEQDGQLTLTGGQIIGWDPRRASIVSWHFDPRGGFGNDVWRKDGSRWIIQATGVFHDGSESTAVNIVSPIDKDSFNWQSVQRTLDGVNLPDIPNIKIVRVPSGE